MGNENDKMDDVFDRPELLSDQERAICPECELPWCCDNYQDSLRHERLHPRILELRSLLGRAFPTPDQCLEITAQAEREMLLVRGKITPLNCFYLLVYAGLCSNAYRAQNTGWQWEPLTDPDSYYLCYLRDDWTRLPLKFRQLLEAPQIRAYLVDRLTCGGKSLGQILGDRAEYPLWLADLEHILAVDPLVARVWLPDRAEIAGMAVRCQCGVDVRPDYLPDRMRHKYWHDAILAGREVVGSWLPGPDEIITLCDEALRSGPLAIASGATVEACYDVILAWVAGPYFRYVLANVKEKRIFGGIAQFGLRCDSQLNRAYADCARLANKEVALAAARFIVKNNPRPEEVLLRLRHLAGFWKNRPRPTRLVA